jgi:hypothetical protein
LSLMGVVPFVKRVERMVGAPDEQTPPPGLRGY